MSPAPMVPNLILTWAGIVESWPLGSVAGPELLMAMGVDAGLEIALRDPGYGVVLRRALNVALGSRRDALASGALTEFEQSVRLFLEMIPRDLLEAEIARSEVRS